ncbi:MAG: hypothetical protein WBQ79_19690 [Acidobacteriaceae bacterium]
MIYFFCLSELAAVTALFFGVARGGFCSFGIAQRILRVLVALPLLVSGVAHFSITTAMAQIIPPIFPARTLLVMVSGVAELAGAAGLFFRRTERLASLSIVLLMIAVFPANIYAAGQTLYGLRMPMVPSRLFMQSIYIVLVLIAGWGRPVLRSQ